MKPPATPAARTRRPAVVLLSQADVDRLNELRPWCAVCNTQVAFITWQRLLSQPVIHFHVECHGAIETINISIERLQHLLIYGIPGGVAFNRISR